MNRTAQRGALAALAAVALLAIAVQVAVAFSGDGRAQPTPKSFATQRVAIDFTAVAGKKPVTCSTPIASLGTTARNARLGDLRFYVSNVQLLRKDGKAVSLKLPADSPWWTTQGKNGVTLIDLENAKGACATEGTPGMNASVRGTVPSGGYVGVRWLLGVPYALNHTDMTTAPAPLNITALGWSWQVGRKYAKIEVTDAGDGAPWPAKTFFVHLGSTACAGNPVIGEDVGCSYPNRHDVTLKKFNPQRQRIAVDLKTLYAGVDVTTNGGGAGGCMSSTSDPECPAIFSALGMKLGSSDETRQSVFRVVGK